MTNDAKQRILDAFEMIAPREPAYYAPIRKKWLFFDVENYCEECGHETLRLAWPWKTSYEPRWGRPVPWSQGITSMGTDFGKFDIVHEWIEPVLPRTREDPDPALD